MPIDDPLAYLQWRPVLTYAKRDTLYDQHCPPEHLYLLVQGRVKITSVAFTGVTARFVSPDGLFGECSLVPGVVNKEYAVALETVTVMRWTLAEIEQQIERTPALGVALCQYQALRCMQLQHRIEVIARYTTRVRVMVALLDLASDCDTPTPGGGMARIPPLTQTTLAEYIGTSREVVGSEMSRLRRKMILYYNRRFIDVDLQALQRELARSGVRPYCNEWRRQSDCVEGSEARDGARRTTVAALADVRGCAEV